ncbi:MAG: fibronectin type III domain-containing protein [Myxococcota bacterium]
MLLLPLSRVRACAAVGFFTLALATGARADAVLLRFYPPAQGAVAGYKVYAARQTTGAIASAPIDAGVRSPDGTGVASYSLSGLDPNLPYSVEMTAYDARGVESQRSNRVTISSRVETLGGVRWSSSFGQFAPGVHVPGFRDELEDAETASGADLFAVAYFPDGTAAFGSDADAGDVSSWFVGAGAPYWGSYEITGRVWTSGARAQAGIDARASGRGRYFDFGQAPGGSWRLVASEEPALSCKSAVTRVTQPPGTWYAVRFRVTHASGLTRLRAKVWPSEGAEPAAWQADCWTTLAVASDLGAIALRRGGTGGAYFEDLTVTSVIGKLDPIPAQ